MNPNNTPKPVKRRRMKKFFVMMLLMSYISSNDYPNESTMITMKYQSSKVLPNFRGETQGHKWNHEFYSMEGTIEKRYVPDKTYKVIQINPNSFIVVGSPASNWQ